MTGTGGVQLRCKVQPFGEAATNHARGDATTFESELFIVLMNNGIPLSITFEQIS
jgi:hypothetical protein